MATPSFAISTMASPCSSRAVIAAREAVPDGVRDQLVDEQCQHRRLLRGYVDIGGGDVEGYRQPGRHQRAMGLIGGVSRDDVDRRPAEPALVAEQIVHRGNGLHATDRFSQL